MSEEIKRKSTETKRDIPYVKLTYCDECGRLIRQRVCTGFSNLRKIDHKHRVEWYQVTTGHRDLGSESSSILFRSADSTKETDVCTDCIRTIFDRYLTTSQGENDDHISVDHCWAYNEEPMEDKNES